MTKDPLKEKLFQKLKRMRLSQAEIMIELKDYDYQMKNFREKEKTNDTPRSN